ncbi:acetyl-CoA hydrolase/transferase C-terminal domain-containing protein [Gallaecimonas xiamenensis]|uniref:Acetyl-CoA hydrolase n=1 Tax=Gallaecimonas xiamenensis 3-C-1 TaxID=745411 RepID=K2JU31_9GAMM|nr:acetyl-CoA hydrolase/transferase C-terminal domain-containing protein [Gallaecimonas xiamenensis]EKE78012.1 acetyl-CoA hydrolase [Gallaecimonas xiamenensis 3-C-1]
MSPTLIDRITDTLGNHWVVGTPLGVGKANRLLNQLYLHAKANPHIQLTLITALSLNPPVGRSELEERFLSPLRRRIWGQYPVLAYQQDRDAGTLPANVRVLEFYARSGSLLHHPQAQQDYISSNYTHAGRDILDRGINLLVQAVAKDDNTGRYSLGSNPDLSLDVAEALAQSDRPSLVIGEVNRQMPFMGNDAEVGEDFFDLVVDDGDPGYPLFATPQEPIAQADYAIGLRASALVDDGGTLQVGIGALADAAVQGLRLRQQQNGPYRQMLGALGEPSEVAPMTQGLYVASELISHPVLTLFDEGLICRQVFEDEGLQQLINDKVLASPLAEDSISRLRAQGALPRHLEQRHCDWLHRHGFLTLDWQPQGLMLAGQALTNDLDQPQVLAALDKAAAGNVLKGGIAMHGAFFVGPSVFYERLRTMDPAQKALIGMTSVLEVNRIYTHYHLERLQRQKARFINITMKATLLGHAVSDQLADGQVVSGVGGQYNFVAMAHQLPGARSVLLVKATRGSGKALESNIVWEYPHSTIPRHLRDIFVSEYGIADLRGKTDSECIDAMVKIADSRFQDALIGKAKAAGKLPKDYQLPEQYRHNLPQVLDAKLAPFSQWLAPLPFGSELTDFELELAGRLGALKKSASSLSGKLALLWQCLGARSSAKGLAALKHLDLSEPKDLKGRFFRRLVLSLFH